MHFRAYGRRARRPVGLGFLLLLEAGGARAEGPEAWLADAWSAEAALTSDYVYRGQSFSDGGPAFQASARWENAGAARLGGLHADAWLSSIDFGAGDPTDAEASLTVGYETAAGRLQFDGGVTYISYVNAPHGGTYDYAEIYGAASAPLGAGALTAEIHYTPRYSGDAGPALFTDLAASWPVNEIVSVDAAAGHAHLDPAAGADYFYWQLGLTAHAGSVSFDIRYHDHTQPGCTRACAGRVALTVAKSF